MCFLPSTLLIVFFNFLAVARFSVNDFLLIPVELVNSALAPEFNSVLWAQFNYKKMIISLARFLKV